MGGGDLLNLLIERDVFDENFTRFYVAEVGIVNRSGSTINSSLRHRWYWLSSLAINMGLFIEILNLT